MSLRLPFFFLCLLSLFFFLFITSPSWGEEESLIEEDKIVEEGEGDEDGDIERPEDDKELASLVMSDEDVIPYRDYAAPFSTVWKGVLKSLKFYPLQGANKFIGQVQTRWIDDTLWRRLLEKGEDDYGSEKPSKIKILISVRRITQKKALSSASASIRAGEKGEEEKKMTEHLTRVVIYKRHQEYDSDSEKWKSYPSDWLLEEALFYNIEHAVSVQRQIAELFRSKN